MGVIAKHKRKITLYYHSETDMGKKTLAYAQGTEKEVLEIDISKTGVSGTQWAEIAENLGMSLKDLVRTDSAKYQELYGEETPKLDEHDWIRILENEPTLLRAPIAIVGEDHHLITEPFQFSKLLEDDSAGLEKS